jgi:thiol-disulfide isomerase/thioredoxin
MEVCHQKAISLKAGSGTLKAPEGGISGEPETSPDKRKRNARIAWGIALAVLCSALLWFNLLDPALKTAKSSAETMPALAAAAAGDAETEDSSFRSDAPVGYEVGMQLQDFTLTCLDGSEFHLADTRGKVTFINLWATYCTPCVKELPHFDALYREHEDDIAMLAVHSSMVVDEPADYLADKGWTIPFAVDTDDDMLWEIVNGSTTLPQTIVLNRRGEVIYNQKGSVTPEMLAALYEQAANS